MEGDLGNDTTERCFQDDLFLTGRAQRSSPILSHFKDGLTLINMKNLATF